jgi:hypothetical protein
MEAELESVWETEWFRIGVKQAIDQEFKAHAHRHKDMITGHQQRCAPRHDHIAIPHDQRDHNAIRQG